MAISQFPTSNPSPEAEEYQALIQELAEKTGFGDDDEVIDFFVKMIGLPDEDFEALAPHVSQLVSQQFNTTENKLALAQSLNANGMKLEDLEEDFEKLTNEIEKLPISNTKKAFVLGLFVDFFNSANEVEGIAKRVIRVPIERCHEDAKIPVYAHDTDSGMDLYALEDITIKPGETVLVPTGIKVALPPGFELQVRPKSGRALKTKLRVANTPGTIDQGYRDEIKVIIENIDPPIRAIHTDFAQSPNDPIPVGAIDFGQTYTIGKGEKFAQLVLAEVPRVAWFEVENVGEIGEDRGGGFGSTGVK